MRTLLVSFSTTLTYTASEHENGTLLVEKPPRVSTGPDPGDSPPTGVESGLVTNRSLRNTRNGGVGYTTGGSYSRRLPGPTGSGGEVVTSVTVHDLLLRPPPLPRPVPVDGSCLLKTEFSLLFVYHSPRNSTGTVPHLRAETGDDRLSGRCTIRRSSLSKEDKTSAYIRIWVSLRTVHHPRFFSRTTYLLSWNPLSETIRREPLPLCYYDKQNKIHNKSIVF